MQERRGHAVRRSIEGDVEGVADKLPGCIAGSGLLQCAGVTDALTLQADEAFDGLGAGAYFAHGVQIQLEVAVMTLFEALIRFFAQYDLIDQACGFRVLRGKPGQSNAGQFLLQALGQ
ncbi:hypothetical protein D3C79_965600 [compost metagenome]